MMKERGKHCFVFNLIFVTLYFLLVCNNVKSVNAASVPTDGTRYTVLAIDLSGSMRGTPLDAAKKSAKKFCAAMMSSEGKNYIAIIFYESSAKIECEFTDDLDKINTTIDGFSASGGTNMNEALLNAESIIDQLPSSATKNVVLLSDGLPESGKRSQEGPYSALDHSSYEYGNAVYDTAVALQSKCNIYTLGFFHSSTGNDRTFGQKLLKDVQNKGYYDVQNPDDLEFVFGELADTITDSTMKKLWVQQHKQYIGSDQYRKDIINGYSDYLYDIAKYDAGNTKVTAYNTLNTMKKFLGKENWGYKEEYEFILAQLMFNENSYKGIQENFTVNMLQNLSKGGKYIIEYLEKTINMGIASGDAKDLERIKELFNKMEELSWKSKEYNDAYSEYKTLVNKHMTSKDALKTLSKKFNIAASTYEVVMNTASDTLEYIAYGEAYMSISDDMQAILRLMYYEVGQNMLENDEEGLMFIESLIQYEYLSQALEESIIAWEEYKEDKNAAITHFVGHKVGEETVNQILDVAITGVMSKLPVLKAFAILREGLDAGMDFVDVLSNIDDYAYAGNMVGRLYYFTKVMYDVVDECGDNLKGTDEHNLDKAFYYASVFDEAVSMYRTTVCLVSDYAISFEESNLQNELKKMFPNQEKVSWYSSAISMAATQKMLAEQIYCHNTEIKYDHVYKTFDFGTELKVFTVACPVSITVKDNTGKQLAYLSDDIVDIEAGYEQYFNRIALNDSYVKTAVVPKDCSVSISGSGTGTMNTYVASLQNYKIEKYQAFENIKVTEKTNGYFEQDASDTYDLIINNQKQQETTRNQSDTTEDDVYEEFNSITNNNITIAMNQNSYECYEGGAFTVKAKITVPETYEYGSHKYIGYYAYLNKGNWEQIASWWIDGGETVYPIKMTIHEWEKKGNNLFVISVFPVDNFVTGGSLCDKMFYVNMLEEAPGNDSDQDNGGQGSTNRPSLDNKYSNVEYVNVTLDAAGGDCFPRVITRRYLDIYDDLPVPVKEGYTFDGWYSEQNGQGKEKVWNSTIIEKTNHTLYAHWIENEKNNTGDNPSNDGGIGNSGNTGENEDVGNSSDKNEIGGIPSSDGVLTYYINYDLNGGNVSGNPTSYTEKTKSFVLKNPVREGYIFIGWTGSNGNIPQTSVIINKGSTGNKLYIANWEKKILSLENVKVSGIKSKYTYKRKGCRPLPIVHYGSEILQRGVDYTLTFKDNKKVGVATIVIQGKGNYAKSKKINFKIVPKGTSFRKLKMKSKEIILKWKKLSKQVTGYEIQYSTNKHFASNKTRCIRVKKPSVTSITIKQKKKRKNYIRIRTYKNVAGKKYYSSWSKVTCIR